MKRILSTLTLLLCFAFTAVNAQVITAERAAEIANSFFSAGVQKSAAARGVVSSPSLTSSFDSNDVTETASAEPTFYVLTNPEGGFVIVSGEETENPIIGYSLDGTIDVNNLPDGFVGYMTDIDAQVKSLREYNANNPQKAAAARSVMQRAASYEYNATTMGNIVKDLNTAPWGQGEPFNNLCYVGATGTTSKAKTGCGPTAFAILCYYYKWPVSGVGTVTHQGTGENMELGHTYDYASMLHNYSSGYTTEQADAVALLMRDLGWANQVGYGTSSTSYSETAQHMVDHFRFKSERPVDHGASLAVVRSTLGNDTQWKTYIKNSLDAGYPIPYASTTDASNSGRHIYILDGYTDNDYYHFNWGWSGQGNGWFTLDNMVPDDYSDYSNSHKAYYIIPDATTYTITATVNDSTMGTVSINNGTAGSTATADLMQGVTATLTANPAAGYALASWTKNGEIVGTKNTIEVTVGTDANDYVANFDDEANVIVVQDYTINATSGTNLTTDKIQEWTFNTNNDYPATLKLISTATSINTNNAGDCIQLHLISPKTSETYTLSVQEDYEITQYTIRCKATASYNIKVVAEGQEITPTTSYADYTFERSNTLARTASNSASFTVTGSTGRYMQVESITVTVAKEGANVGGGSTTCTITTVANPAEGGTAKFAVGTGSQKIQGDVENGTQITLYAVANTGYNFVNWTLGGNVVGTDATCNVTVSQEANYVANFEAVQQGGSSSTNLAGKYFRLKQKNTTNYMNIYDNNTHGQESRGGVNVTTKNESNDGQIFQFIESGTNYKLLSKTGYYVTWKEWNVNADSKDNGADLTFEPTATELEYLISCAKGYFKIDTDKGTPSLGKFVYSDGAQGAAATWVLEEVVYYTVTATAGEGGSVSPLTSTVEKGKPVTLTATANSGYRFVNWTLNGNVVSTDASYTFNATAAGEYVANFEISTYTISATANPGTAGSVTINGEAVSSKNVNENSTVTLVATPQAGYCFVNWTKDGVEVSTDATYSFTATEITSLVANFEEIVVNATLTDAQSNTYNVQLSGFANGVTKETVAAKLTEKYPYITLGDNATLDNAAYTYSNNVTLPFKVSSVSDATKTYWYNIYYPSNGDARNPNYIAAFNDEDDIVDMAESPNYAYGENPTYNTKAGNPMISWTVYSVNNSFEFVFKNELTNKYIKVESVVNATGNTQNVKFVDNAGAATAFTLLNDAGSYNGDYALVAKVGDATGYLCAAFSDEDYVTHFDSNTHQGAWVKIVEAPDYFSKIMDMGIMLGLRFGAGDGKCVIAGTNIEEVDNAMQNSGSITLNKLNDYAARMEAAMATENPTWFNVTTSAENGAAYITLENDDPELTSKRVPGGYELTVKATPATGYHFTGWTMNGTAIEGATEELRFTVTEATTIVASYAINTYNVNVTAGENGSVTVTHDVNGETVDINGKTVDFATVIKIEATPNDGYEFIGWYNGEELQHSINPHEFAINHDINYTARFEEEAGETPTTYAIRIETVDIDGNPLINNATGPVKAIIKNVGQEWATAEDFVDGATAELVAVSDLNQSAYLFVGWYKNGVKVGSEHEISITVTETATYQARFVKGYVVTLTSDNKTWGYPNMITYSDGSPVVGAATELKALVEPGKELLISVNTNYGFRVANWTDKNDNVVAGKNANSFTITPDGDNQYTAHMERATYTLSVSTQQGTMGEVSATFQAESGASVIVGHNMEATITASPYTGYRFVEWTTTDGTHVSDENPYTVPAIQNVENMVDVEYVAVFEVEESVNPNVGTYYRIGYDGFDAPAAASAARAAATRAVGDVQTYVVSPTTGTPNGAGTLNNYWTFSKSGVYQADLTMVATSNGTAVEKINTMKNGTQHSLFAYYKTDGVVYGITYTVSVPENGNYKITGYSIGYTAYQDVTVNGSTATNNGKTGSIQASGLDVYSFDFTVSSTSNSGAIDIDNFTVTIQQVSEDAGGEGAPETPEIPANRYYIQSEASNVSGKANALLMTQETGAASIFYYADNKLMSYKTGTFVKENSDGARGLQAIGVENGGNVTITTNGNTSTIAVTSYMHANKTNDGSVKFVDHCGSNPDDHAANHNFVLEEVTSLPVTITDAGYATWYAPVAVQLPDGLTAYTITIHGDYAITGDGFKQVPANTGVILEGTKGTTYELEIIGSASEVESIMKGSVAATYFPENDYAYVLSTDKGTRELGFYMADDGEASWSHKAYLPASEVPAGAALSAGFRLILPGTTAIEEVETENNIDAIYDLTGRKLEGISGTGIYIINGKKVIVR